MKKIKKLLLVFFLLVIYTYMLAIDNIPKNLVVFEGENITMKTLFGINIKQDKEVIETSSSNKTISKEPGKTTLNVSLFDNISLKNINIDVLPKTKVIPVGSIAGLKLYTSGVLVVGMSEIQGIDNKRYKPYENSGIEEGDTIININNIDINSTEELIQTVNNAYGNPVKVKYIHENQTKECSIDPVQTSNNEYKLGLWVRDSAAGVGTVSFYDAENRTFGALGHGITDIDTRRINKHCIWRICNHKNFRNIKRRKWKSTGKYKEQ